MPLHWNLNLRSRSARCVFFLHSLACFFTVNKGSERPCSSTASYLQQCATVPLTNGMLKMRMFKARLWINLNFLYIFNLTYQGLLLLLFQPTMHVSVFQDDRILRIRRYGLDNADSKLSSTVFYCSCENLRIRQRCSFTELWIIVSCNNESHGFRCVYMHSM